MTQTTQVILDILICVSVPSLPDLAACHGNSFSPRGPLVAIASLVHTTPSMHPVPPLAAYSLLPLSHCIPPSYSSSYRTHLPDATNASYMPHLDASASAWHQLRRCSAHTYAILHTLFTNGCRLSPFSLPSVGACYRYLSSLNVGVSKIEIRDHSNTKTTTPLPTAKVTDETNNLAYTPTDANTNLNARSTVDDSSQNARCLSSSRCCSTTQHRRVEVLSVGCLGFGFDTTAGVDVEVEPISERVLRFRLNASSPSPAPHVQLSDDSSFALPETVPGWPPLRAI